MAKRKRPVLKAPYQYFGGKSRVAKMVWDEFGRVVNYLEPFFGSGATLLGRPTPIVGQETINDLNAFLTNFWRALRAEPDEVAKYADWPINEVDLHKRGDWLFYRKGVKKWIRQVMDSEDFYDTKSAGWWVWGTSASIGDMYTRKDGKTKVGRSMPSLGGNEGVHRKLSRHVDRKMPSLSGWGGLGRKNLLDMSIRDAACEVYLESDELDPTVTYRTYQLREYMRALCTRMREVRICCGDWSRYMGPSVTYKHGLTGVFLDPPYTFKDRSDTYGECEDTEVGHEVRKWCAANGDNPLLRIALCGYEGEHNELEEEGWRKEQWHAQGGYSNQNKTEENENRYRERIWFSPHCLGGLNLFAISKRMRGGV